MRGGREIQSDTSLLSRWINYADQITYGEQEVGASGEDVNRERHRGQGKNKSRWRSGSKGTNVTGGEWHRGPSG